MSRLLPERLELVGGGRAVRVGGDEERPATELDDVPGELGGRGRLARALEADHGDDRRVARQVEGPVAGRQERDELVVDDLDDLLAGRQAVEDLVPDRPLADARHEVLDDLEVDVGLEQRQADLAHGGVDVGFADPAAAGQVAERLAQPLAEGVEHGPGRDSSGWLTGPGATPQAGPGGARVLTHRGGRVYRRPSRTPPSRKSRPPRTMLPPVRNPFASPLWRNPSFVRVWSAATISIFGSLITRIALPLVAILVLGVGRARGRDPARPRPRRDARVRARGRRVGRSAAPPTGPHLGGPRAGGAARLGPGRVRRSGVLSFPQLLVVTGLAAILTTFFDAADNAYLPTIVEREQLVDANSALAASGSAAEFMAFGISGFLVQLLTAPIAIAIDAVTFLASALLLGTIRTEEAPPPRRRIASRS